MVGVQDMKAWKHNTLLSPVTSDDASYLTASLWSITNDVAVFPNKVIACVDIID